MAESRAVELLRKRLNEGPDLSRFTALNDRKASFKQRQSVVRELFPPVVPLMAPESPACEQAWFKAFDRDPDLMGRILRDIIKADQAVPGRSGPRPGIDAARAGPQVDTWLGKDYRERPYSELSFAESFTILAGNLSLRSLAHKTKLTKTHVERLKAGSVTPTASVIEQVAAAFKKQPSWFLEYRVGFVATVLVTHLMARPDRSIRGFELLFQLGVTDDAAERGGRGPRGPVG